jgi:hypothetical protein
MMMMVMMMMMMEMIIMVDDEVDNVSNNGCYDNCDDDGMTCFNSRMLRSLQG